ncbi:MAG: VWA domain-containing protein [Treponema sp.]|nr:VWA domain-containing protein [Treponema sp.]
MAKKGFERSDGISGNTVRRSLHFFWLIDWSGSMAGENIQKVNYAIRNVIPEIRRVEENDRINIYMRAIKFGSNAQWHMGPEPIPVSKFNWIDMDASGGATATSQALDMLTSELDISKIGKRNVPPVVILMSDGGCTDEPESLYYEAIARLNESPWGKKAVRIAIGIGNQNDYNKEQLDSFISPYLRQKQGVETFPASDARKLTSYIQAASLVATQASSQSQGDGDDPDSPVILQKIEVNEDSDGPDFSKLKAGDVF